MADDLSAAQADDDPRPHGPRPAAVAWVAAALGLEALVLVVLAGFGVVSLLGPGESVVAVALALVVLALLGAWLLAACARGVLDGRTWARGPSVTVQILALLVAYSFVEGGSRALPAVIAGVAGITLVGLMLPSVARYTRRDSLPFADED